MPRYFVKFVKFNTNTIEALINKQVKFSTVYEFNDFNELKYLGHIYPPPNIKTIITEHIKDPTVQTLLISNALDCGVYNRSYVNDIITRLKDFNKSTDTEIFYQSEPKINDWPLFMESLAFASVGIFCVSDLIVFKDDSAQLMFAHYADSLKGLALIYEIADEMSLINMSYTPFDERKGSSGDPDRFKKYLNGIFDDVEDFRSKSNKWGYEKEGRMFDKPGIYSTDAKGLKLKAILHTPRFPIKSIDTLNNINEKHYHNTLKIKELDPSVEYCKFRIDKKDAYEWLMHNLQD